MQRSFNAKQPWLWLLLVLCAFYFVGLGQLPLLGPDEPRYAQVAREMFENRDLVTPTLGHHTWFEKPALYYWMTIAAYRVFGVSEASARIAAASSGVLTALFAFLLGGFAARRSNGALPEWFGALTGVVVASSCGLIGFSRGASFDIVLTMALTSALSCFLAYEIDRGGRYKRWLLAGFYAGVGLSLLAKGLVGIVLPGGIIFSYYLIQRRWPRRELWLSLLWGAPIALAVAATWYVPVIKRHGWTFIDEFFIQHHFARYLSNKFHHPQPFYFYFWIVLLLVLPWYSFLVGGIARLKATRLSSENPLSKFDAFALAWFIFPLIFFSISSSKLPGYILPAVPGAALLISRSVAAYIQGEARRAEVWSTGGLFVLVGSAAPAVLIKLDYASTGVAVFLGLCTLGTGVFLLMPGRDRVVQIALVVLCLHLSALVALYSVAGHVGANQSLKAAYERAAAEGFGDLSVYELHTIERSSEFYAADRLRRGADGEVLKFEGPNEVVEQVRREGTVIVIVPHEYEWQISQNPSLKSRVMGESEEFRMFVVSPSP